ncbi:hypothetical protein HSX10_18605 [Winogradskyella undariae]|uniref:hypothetical protein n=1 Tax=Winogradskyella undariae TaxID=1285465 RepID=UPI00156A7AF6|nr:hypothetical protein [Winogradskyella undariae]NRR93584.1 hypothetical protein [Winogradskyella undariae]
MKHIILVVLLFLAFSCKGQDKKQNEFNYEDFNSQILKYEPIKKNGVSEKDFQKGLFKLKETKIAVDKDPKKLNYADFWNITMAFVNLDESSKNIEISFKKAVELNPSDVCALIKAFGNSELDIRIPETFYPFVNNCSNLVENNETFNPKTYSEKNKLDLKLVSLINEIHLNDIKYRFDKTVDWSKQNPLDEKNQKLIDSLYLKYKTYIGKSLVGNKLETIMWVVIQHSNLEMMEKYLPIIQRAVKENQLQVVPLKMLIDRVYLQKYNYQIFGSQQSPNLADEKTRNEVRKKYEIE